GIANLVGGLPYLTGSFGNRIVLSHFRSAHPGEEPDRDSGENDQQQDDQPSCAAPAPLPIADDCRMRVSIAARRFYFGGALFDHGNYSSVCRCNEPESRPVP